MRPSVSTPWVSYPASYIAEYDGGPVFPPNLNYLTLPDTQTRTNRYTGITTDYMYLPDGQNRYIFFNVDSAINGVRIQISGEDTYGNVFFEDIDLPEILNVPPVPYYSANQYNIIYYIGIYQPADAELAMQVSIGGGSYDFYKTDIWNQNAMYTIAYSDVSGGVSLTPVYKTNSLETFVDSVQTPNNDTTDIYDVPIANTSHVVVSPSSITSFPITTNASVSISNIPMSGLSTAVGNATTGSFVQTIIQQGAAY